MQNLKLKIHDLRSEDMARYFAIMGISNEQVNTQLVYCSLTLIVLQYLNA